MPESRRRVLARWALRLWRAGAVALLAVLTGWQIRSLESPHASETVDLHDVRLLFPAAAAVSVPGADGSQSVYGSDGSPLGSVVRTAPQTDRIIGYSGPSDVLVGIDPGGRVSGVTLLRSGDTPDHVEAVAADPRFLHQFAGWKPGSPFPRVEAVSGATLTSSAIAESIHLRLAGGAPSLRFPDAVSLEEIRALLPEAAAFREESGRYRVLDQRGELTGFVVRTSPSSDDVSGYRGPSESLVALAPDGRTISSVRLRKSYDTESYVQQIRDDEWYLNEFRERTADAVAGMDFEKEGIEGVSGATQTSWAIAEGMKRRFAMAPPAPESGWKFRTRDWLAAAVAGGALLMAFTGLRGKRAVRILWQAALMGWALWSGGDLISLALLAGWTRHGIPWAAAPGAALIAAVALLVPWAARRQVYCHHICPHGTLQQWMGRITRRRFKVPATADAWLRCVPWILLAFVPLFILVRADLSQFEPFDAWVWRATGFIPVIIAVIGLAASVFVPQAYCRYGCPTGALLAFVRSPGGTDRPGRRDAAFAVLLLFAVAGTALGSMHPHPPAVPGRAVLEGKAMGTNWEVVVRGDKLDLPALTSGVAGILASIESDLSGWRPESAVSRFNASHETIPADVPSRVSRLVETGAAISRETGGAFDITAGPLVRLWGFGPGAAAAAAEPDAAAITAAQAHAGWQHLTLESGRLTKSDPLTEIDLTALTEGLAAEEVAAWLQVHGVREFLINIGGELRAAGTWPVAIDHPLRTVLLTDGAIATSGTYRQKRTAGGRSVSHLIDARTGQPTAHRTVGVSVRHANTVLADGWATALAILGREEGLATADRLGLAAEFVEEAENGELSVTASRAWHRPGGSGK